MALNELVRAIAYLFVAAVALLFSARMYVRARRASGKFAIPPHWYDVVCIYMLGIACWGIGLSLRLLMAPYTSEHTRMIWGFVYLFIVILTSATALYFFVKPRKLLNKPTEVPSIPDNPGGNHAAYH